MGRSTAIFDPLMVLPPRNPALIPFRQSHSDVSAEDMVAATSLLHDARRASCSSSVSASAAFVAEQKVKADERKRRFAQPTSVELLPLPAVTRMAWPGGKISHNKPEAIEAFILRKRKLGALSEIQEESLRASCMISDARERMRKKGKKEHGCAGKHLQRERRDEEKRIKGERRADKKRKKESRRIKKQKHRTARISSDAE